MTFQEIWTSRGHTIIDNATAMVSHELNININTFLFSEPLNKALNIINNWNLLYDEAYTFNYLVNLFIKHMPIINGKYNNLSKLKDGLNEKEYGDNENNVGYGGYDKTNQDGTYQYVKTTNDITKFNSNSLEFYKNTNLLSLYDELIDDIKEGVLTILC